MITELDALLAHYKAASLEELIDRANKLADGPPKQPDPAVAIYQDILLVQPDHPGILFALALQLREAGRYMWALQIAKRICSERPKDPRGWRILATTYGEMCKYEESIRYAEKAYECAQGPDATLEHKYGALGDYAYALCNVGDWDRARAAADKVITMSAENRAFAPEPRLNAVVTKAYCDLARGNWVEGFGGYRATMRTKFRKERVYPGPNGDTKEWWGEPNATVIVTGEQGLGDEIMAAGMIPQAANQLKLYGKFVLDCDHRLEALFARSFPGVYVTPQRRSEQLVLPRAVGFPTHHKTLFGLGELFRKRDEDFPREPYLVPNQEYVEMFREFFGGQKVIGLAWSGGLPRTGMAQRQAGLAAFLPLVRRGGAEFVSLQYKDDAEEVRQFEAQHGIRVRRLPWVTQGPDMDLLAGLVASLSEVVSVGTAVAHMASALGVPTTILVNRGLGWAFAPPEMLWYPKSTTLWRKQTGESWRECVARLVEARK